jgi:hypothetical protein
MQLLPGWQGTANARCSQLCTLGAQFVRARTSRDFPKKLYVAGGEAAKKQQQRLTVLTVVPAVKKAARRRGSKRAIATRLRRI